MAIVRIPDEGRTLTNGAEIQRHLASIGIGYEQWPSTRELAAVASAEDILRAYAREIEKLKQLGAYVTADVIDVHPQTPGLEEMLAKFSGEHWHDEDEVRFIVHGRGIFHINPTQGSLTAVEVEPGDLLTVPAGTLHWFDLCADRRIRAIRLFRETSGWVPHYTGSGRERKYEPACFGPSYIPPQRVSV